MTTTFLIVAGLAIVAVGYLIYRIFKLPADDLEQDQVSFDELDKREAEAWREYYNTPVVQPDIDLTELELPKQAAVEPAPEPVAEAKPKRKRAAKKTTLPKQRAPKKKG
jgi:hypothetical protein